MSIWHLTIAADGRHPLFPAERERRAAVRALARAAPTELALFCVVDDHVHLVVLGDRPRVGRLARAVVLGLRRWAAPAVEGARIREVATRAHAESLVRYVLGQTAHHELPEHPALWTGSCFQDLVGARSLPGLRLRLAEVLPRVGARGLLAAVGLRAAVVAPADDEAVRRAGPTRLAAAGAAALAVDPTLGGRSAPVVTARRVVMQLGCAAGIARAELAWALGVGRWTAWDLQRVPAEPALLRAARVRLALEDLAVPGEGGSGRPPSRPLPDRAVG